MFSWYYINSCFEYIVTQKCIVQSINDDESTKMRPYHWPMKWSEATGAKVAVTNKEWATSSRIHYASKFSNIASGFGIMSLNNRNSVTYNNGFILKCTSPSNYCILNIMFLISYLRRCGCLSVSDGAWVIYHDKSWENYMDKSLMQVTVSSVERFPRLATVAD